MSELQLQSTSISHWWEYVYEVVIECVPTVCNDMDCVPVLEKTATKFFVEGILGRVSIRNESNGFASVVYYVLVAMAKAVDIWYIKSIIPLVGATFTLTDELSFNELSAEIMMFSFEHNDYYEFGRFNFNSCAVRSKVLSRVAKRPASAINSNNPAPDFSAVILPESDSECERKDPSCVLPRAPNRNIAEYEEWDEDLFILNEAKLGSKRSREKDDQKPSPNFMSEPIFKMSPSSRTKTVLQQVPLRGKVLSSNNGNNLRSQQPDMQTPVSSLSSDSTVPCLREVSFTTKISSPEEASMKQLQSPKRDAKERLKGIFDAARIQFYQMKGICTDVEVKYFKTLKKIFDVNMCKDHTALEGRECLLCINTLTVGDVYELRCEGTKRDGKGCRIHIHKICFFSHMLQKFTSLSIRRSRLHCLVCNSYLIDDDELLKHS